MDKLEKNQSENSYLANWIQKMVLEKKVQIWSVFPDAILRPEAGN